VSNTAIMDIFDETNILGLSTNKILEVGGHKEFSWMGFEVSIEFEETSVWELFDAINEQLPSGISWGVDYITSKNNNNYALYFLSILRVNSYKEEL